MPSDRALPAFLSLEKAEKAEALAIAADILGRPAHLLEKDAWVVWTLNTLFTAPFGSHLVFKGGTSLSKAYGIIDRFSEDIDLTYDITAFIPELAKATGGRPPSRSQAAKWSQEVRKRLPQWIAETALPAVQAALKESGLPASLSADEETLFIDYTPATGGTGYVKPQIVAEFGARSTGEPAQEVSVTCDAAPVLETLTFPVAAVRAMAPERTFWEKATAVHVFCSGGRNRGRPAFARHWHDLTKLDAGGYAAQALADRTLASAVADHKTYFFQEKNEAGAAIDYHAAIKGSLLLVPGGARLDELRKDYESMIEDGLLNGGADTFDALLKKIKDIETRANAAAPNTGN